MSNLRYIERLVMALLLLLLALAPAMAQQNVVYQGETSTLSVEQKGYDSYQWELYSDSTVNFAVEPGDPNPMVYAEFVGPSDGSTVYIQWRKPGIYFFKVTAFDAAGCSTNLKIGIIKVKKPLPKAVITPPDSMGICAGKEVVLEVTFTGEAPWSITYSGKDSTGNTQEGEINDIMTSPYLLIPDPQPLITTQYRITTIKDINGTNTAGSDSVIQIINPLPETSMIYLVNGSPIIGDVTVCLNTTEEFGVTDTPTSTYSWKIFDGTDSTDWAITVPSHNTISVQWNKVGTYVLTVQETNAANCLGPVQSINVIVDPLPNVDPIMADTCSASTIDVILPATDKDSLALTRYDITAVVDSLLSGIATTGTDITDINAIKNDKFTNVTGEDLTVVYTVIPYAGACAGAPFTITVKISSGPEVVPISVTICSDLSIDVKLPVADKDGLALTRYDITAVVDSLLSGIATTGTDITDINAIKNDKFTNVTGEDLTVIYTVTPFESSCMGIPFTITITINPAVKTSRIKHK